MQKSQNAFTFIEMMIVVIVLAVIAAFGIPNYQRSQQRVDERDGINNLENIASAMEIYRVRNDGLYPVTGDINTLAEINTELNMGIIAQNLNYSCFSNNAVNPRVFRCDAIHNTPPPWRVRVTAVSLGVPFCGPGPACPTLP